MTAATSSVVRRLDPQRPRLGGCAQLAGEVLASLEGSRSQRAAHRRGPQNGRHAGPTRNRPLATAIILGLRRGGMPSWRTPPQRISVPTLLQCRHGRRCIMTSHSFPINQAVSQCPRRTWKTNCKDLPWLVRPRLKQLSCGKCLVPTFKTTHFSSRELRTTPSSSQFHRWQATFLSSPRIKLI